MSWTVCLGGKINDVLLNAICRWIQVNKVILHKVMRNHEDFKDTVSVPNYFLKSVVPKFQILKYRSKKIVLLVDKALRIMPENKYVKIEKVSFYYSWIKMWWFYFNRFEFGLKKALNEYAKYILEDNVLIGIVHFDSFARISLPMTRVKDSAARKRIVESITPPLPNNKRSNIWNGECPSSSKLYSSILTHFFLRRLNLCCFFL